MEIANLGDAVRSALIAELKELHTEVRTTAASLTDEQLWKRPLAESNSVGHLMLHLTGNLNHFVGAQLGGSGYLRDREREFTESSPPPRAAVMKGFDDAVAIFERVDREAAGSPSSARALWQRDQSPGASRGPLRAAPGADLLYPASGVKLLAAYLAHCSFMN
jgi:hypothetical protein